MVVCILNYDRNSLVEDVYFVCSSTRNFSKNRVRVRVVYSNTSVGLDSEDFDEPFRVYCTLIYVACAHGATAFVAYDKCPRRGLLYVSENKTVLAFGPFSNNIIRTHTHTPDVVRHARRVFFIFFMPVVVVVPFTRISSVFVSESSATTTIDGVASFVKTLTLNVVRGRGGGETNTGVPVSEKRGIEPVSRLLLIFPCF